MKRKTKLMLALGLAVVMAVALIQAGSWIRPTSTAAAAYSDPVGFVKVDLKRNGMSQLNIPVIPDMALNDTDDSVACVGEMLAEQLTGNTSASLAPRLNIWQPGLQSFKEVYYFHAGVPNPYEDKWCNASPLSVALDMLTNTEGYFLNRPNNAPDTAVATILGDVNIVDTETISLVANWNQICFPYSISAQVNVHITDMSGNAVGNTSPSLADRIYKWDINAQSFTEIYFFHAGVANPYEDKWVNASPLSVSTMTIEPGEAFFYRRVGGSFTWSVPRPFTLP